MVTSRKIIFFCFFAFLFSFIVSIFTAPLLHGIYLSDLSGYISYLVINGFDFSLFFLCFVVLSVFFLKAFGFSPRAFVRDKFTEKDTGLGGNALFEKPCDYKNIAQIRSADKCIGHIYGMLDKKGRKCIDFHPDPRSPDSHMNEHVFAIGASGSGKTYTVGKTYCYQSIVMGHSVIHTDPKGELFTDLANLYRDNGYVVKRLSFSSMIKSNGWDCMKLLRDNRNSSDIGSYVDLFASAVVSQFGGDSLSVFVAGAKTLLKALVLRVLYDNNLPDNEKTLKTVYSWLTYSSDFSFLNALFDPDSRPNTIPRSCIDLWNSVSGGSDNAINNIKLNLTTGLASLGNSLLSDILSTDDIDLNLPGYKPCAYFIQFPVPDTSYQFPLALYFSLQLQSLHSLAVHSKDRSLKTPVDFYLDEFAQCGVIPKLDQFISTVRSDRISLFIVVQSVSQLKTLYGDFSDTIISNCGTWLVLGINDEVSAKLISDRIGNTSVADFTESVTNSDTLSVFFPIEKRLTKKITGTPLLSCDDIFRLPPNSVLILFQRHNPVFANSFPHTLHPLFMNCSTTDDDNERFFDSDRNAIFDHISLNLSFDRNQTSDKIYHVSRSFHSSFSLFKNRFLPPHFSKKSGKIVSSENRLLDGVDVSNVNLYYSGCKNAPEALKSPNLTNYVNHPSCSSSSISSSSDFSTSPLPQPSESVLPPNKSNRNLLE